MKIDATRDRDALEHFLRRDAASHVYALADLDDFFWPDTTWYTGWEHGRVVAVCLVLDKLSIPVVHALCPGDPSPAQALLSSILGELPGRFFANLGLDLVASFRPHWHIASQRVFQKMILAEPPPPPPGGTAALEPLTPRHLDELLDFYLRDAYGPGESDARFFEPYMLAVGPYFGHREGGRLVAAGGVHLVSERYRVAALGNIATHPAHRRRGLGRSITAAICEQLAGRVDLVGLNVMTSNTAAIRCYEALGFRKCCEYLEGVFERRSGLSGSPGAAPPGVP